MKPTLYDIRERDVKSPFSHHWNRYYPTRFRYDCDLTAGLSHKFQKHFRCYNSHSGRVFHWSVLVSRCVLSHIISAPIKKMNVCVYVYISATWTKIWFHWRPHRHTHTHIGFGSSWNKKCHWNGRFSLYLSLHKGTCNVHTGKLIYRLCTHLLYITFKHISNTHAHLQVGWDQKPIINIDRV